MDRPAWLPAKLVDGIGITHDDEPLLESQDALSQASAVLSTEKAGLLRHNVTSAPMDFGSVERHEQLCRVCAALAWAKEQR